MTATATKPASISTFTTLEEAKIQMRKELEALLNTEKLVERVSYLYSRWMDEREYEDFADYATEMKKAIEAHGTPNMTFVRGSKRPFGPVFTWACTVAGTKQSLNIVLYVTSNAVGWKTV